MSFEAPALYLFDSYPRERSIPYRMGLVNDRRELIDFINAQNGRTNVYLSCFAYDRLRAPRRPDYQSARIRHIPLDFDGLDLAVPEAFRLHNKLLDLGLEHSMDLSGGGIHIFIRAEPEKVLRPAAALNGAQMWLERVALAGAAQSIDKESFFGDPARVIRVPNTLNRNKGRWCVPLTAQSFEELAGASDIRAAAAVLSRGPVEVSVEDYVQSGTALDISKWDDDRYAPARGRWVDLNMGAFVSNEADSGIEVVIQNPLVAQMVHPHANNAERGRILMELYEEGYNLSETLRFMREHLSPEKYRHMLYNERQAQRMYERFCR